MARALLRHTVFDRLGNSQKNVTVHVYEPGTTTHIAASMHDARTGGNVLTNPLTTDVNGGVTAYLDETQEVDLLVVQGAVSRTVPSVATSSTSPLEISIAASNASAQAKAGADYVCDGTADDVQIAAAVAALAATGGTVRLSEGTFYIAAPILITTESIAIVGAGRVSILSAANGLNDNVIRISAAAGSLVGNRFERFAIEGNYANQTDGATVEDRSGIYFKGSVGAALVDPVFRDLFIEYCRGAGMSLEGVTGAKLTRCLIDNVTALGNGLASTPVADGVHVSYADDLKVRDFNGQYNTDTGIAVDYSTGVHINAICRANTGNQIAIARQTAKATLRGCIMDGLGVGGYGLRVGKFGVGGASVSSVLTLDDCVIIKNTVGMQIDDHSILLVGNTYSPGSGGDGNGTPFATASGLTFPIFGPGNVGINSARAGSSTIASGQTSVVVTHGLDANLCAAIPIALRHIHITPNEQSTTGRLFAVTAVSSTTFTVTLSGDPGASGWDFSWQARLDV